jgi:hypothetical protein
LEYYIYMVNKYMEIHGQYMEFWMTFHSVGNCIKSQLTKSIIYQRGRSTTNQMCNAPIDSTCVFRAKRSFLWIPVGHHRFFSGLWLTYRAGQPHDIKPLEANDTFTIRRKNKQTNIVDPSCLNRQARWFIHDLSMIYPYLFHNMK